MSSRLFALGYAKPDREKEEKERMKRVEKEDKESIEKTKAKAKLLKEAEKESEQRLSSFYNDVKNKFQDIDIEFLRICIHNRQLYKLYNIDLYAIDYNKYIAYKLLKK
jgi:hypothetical protein